MTLSVNKFASCFLTPIYHCFFYHEKTVYLHEKSPPYHVGRSDSVKRTKNRARLEKLRFANGVLTFFAVIHEVGDKRGFSRSRIYESCVKKATAKL